MPVAKNTADIKFTCAYGSSIDFPQPMPYDANHIGSYNIPEQRLGAKMLTLDGKRMVYGQAFDDINVTDTANSENCKAREATAPYVFEYTSTAAQATVKAQYAMKAYQYGWFEIISTL